MANEGPTVAPPQPDSLNSALYRNIEALKRRQDAEARATGVHDKLAVAIVRFVGSFLFVYLHLLVVAIWVPANLGLLRGVTPWDPTFVILGTGASVEAIFLSTFVLMTQNRMSAENDRRDALDLQINLLSEHEVTRLIHLTSAIAERLGVETEAEIEELKRDVAPEVVLDVIEETAE